MDTDEDENGLEGQVKFSGSTPELDDFTIRVVDGLFSLHLASFVQIFSGPDNVHVTEGPHADVFSKRIGKTHFMGLPVQSGNIWQAKGLVYCYSRLSISLNTPQRSFCNPS